MNVNWNLKWKLHHTRPLNSEPIWDPTISEPFQYPLWVLSTLYLLYVYSNIFWILIWALAKYWAIASGFLFVFKKISISGNYFPLKVYPFIKILIPILVFKIISIIYEVWSIFRKISSFGRIKQNLINYYNVVLLDLVIFLSQSKYKFAFVKASSVK